MQQSGIGTMGLEANSLQIVWLIFVISPRRSQVSQNSGQALVSMWQACGVLPNQGVSECAQP